MLDRLPTAEILKEENGVYNIAAEVFGKGICILLRSQGDNINSTISSGSFYRKEKEIMYKEKHEPLDETQRAALMKQLEVRTDEAEKLLRDPDELECFLEKLEDKLAGVPTLGEYLSYIPTLVEMARSYIKGEYTKIPYGAILIIVAALTYFLAPIDLIPDTIPIVGYMDDALIIYIAVCIVQSDMELYKEWRDTN